MPTNKGERYEGDAQLLKSSSYLRAYHLGGKDVNLTIEAAQVEKVKSMDGTEKKMLVIYFAGKSLGLGLNNTNITTIMDLHGKIVKAWIGKRITLYPTTCNSFGAKVECIRVREKVPAASKPHHAEPDPSLPDDRDGNAEDQSAREDLPFDDK